MILSEFGNRIPPEYYKKVVIFKKNFILKMFLQDV